MTTTRASQAEQTRATVLSTARRLFAERGYDATSLQEIADAMGVRKANVYYYFKTKGAILRELLTALTTPLRELLDELETVEPSLRPARLAAGYARATVSAYRGEGPLNLGDPSLQRDPEASAMLDALAERALQLLFGDAPAPAQRAAFWLALDLGPVLRRFPELSDADLVELVEQLLLRVVGDARSPDRAGIEKRPAEASE
ncbi:TetR/AcrR family transcriptional regulator [Agromyces protaetiae]|uniref:TetR/AcrR family transcriptional regulator n=1 Tax=Agromyces protaetiae TaxID=2509455 RepID=UPI001AA082DA|nr:TetR/AcrR family transcriptional regulator [Agromyces protaetiae]